jgi:uncharacterized integral membrane protein
VLKRFATMIAAFLAAALLVTLAIANRHGVDLNLDPFRPESPVIKLSMPFFYYLFAMLIVGVLLGGAATWLSQGKWRRIARSRTQEALRWKAEAERLTRERDARAEARATAAPPPRQLAVAGR